MSGGKRPLISIVTVSLNNFAGVVRTLESVREQGFADYEHILIDGGSADGTVDYVAKCLALKLLWISEADRGVFDAMNKGVSLASGRYIYFLNSGDIFKDPDVLRSISTELQKEVPILCGRVRTTRNGVFVGMADLGHWLPHQGAFVRADIQKRFPFDARLRIFGDLDFWMRLQFAGLFDPVRVERVIAEMEMDGLGNHPRFVGERWRDKIRLHVKHRNVFRLLADSVLLGTAALAYKLGGEHTYHRFMQIAQLAKRAWSNPWTAVSRIWMAAHSLVMWPFRACVYNSIGFLAFVHPSAVVRNYNRISIGPRAVINHFVTLNCTSLHVGAYSQINPGSVIYGRVHVGNHVMIGPNVTISGGSHRFDRTDVPMMFQGSREQGIFIEDDVWVGANVVIVDGVRIGQGAIVGAGSVVTRDVSAGAIVHGVKASTFRKRVPPHGVSDRL